MESVYNNLEITDSFNIIGDQDQVLQYILKKNDSIIIRRRNLYYLSNYEMEQTIYHKNFALNEVEYKEGEKKVKDDNLIRLKNLKTNFEYVGVFNGGKIMKIIPILYSQLFIRYDCVLAFTSNIDLVEIDNMDSRIKRFHNNDNFLLKDHKFYKVNCKKLKNVDLENFTISDYSYIKDILFLSNSSKFQSIKYIYFLITFI